MVKSAYVINLNYMYLYLLRKKLYFLYMYAI
jgi:hypothetical protein